MKTSASNENEENIKRTQLIKRLNSMGVSHTRGQNPQTMPVDKLEQLVEFLEKRLTL